MKSKKWLQKLILTYLSLTLFVPLSSYAETPSKNLTCAGFNKGGYGYYWAMSAEIIQSKYDGNIQFELRNLRVIKSDKPISSLENAVKVELSGEVVGRIREPAGSGLDKDYYIFDVGFTGIKNVKDDFTGVYLPTQFEKHNSFSAYFLFTDMYGIYEVGSNCTLR